MLRRVTALWTIRSVGLLALVTTVNGCFVANALGALSECPGDTQSVEAGSTVDGIDPDEGLAPLLTTTSGVLTWTLTTQSTPLHVTIARAPGSATAEWDDCPSPAVVSAISVPIYVEVRTDDGLIYTTMSGAAFEGPDGGVQSIQTDGFPLSDISNPAVLYASSSDSPPPDVSVTLNLTADGGTGLLSEQFSENHGVIATFEFTP